MTTDRSPGNGNYEISKIPPLSFDVLENEYNHVEIANTLDYALPKELSIEQYLERDLAAFRVRRLYILLTQYTLQGWEDSEYFAYMLENTRSMALDLGISEEELQRIEQGE